jgi:hypothetical protein
MVREKIMIEKMHRALAIGFLHAAPAALAIAVGCAVVCSAATARAERHWQCGEGVSVPHTGSRKERDTACRAALEKARRGRPRPMPSEQERALRERIEKLEKHYGIDTGAETR